METDFDSAQDLLGILLAPLQHLLDPTDRLGYLYLGTALVVAVMVYIATHARSGTLRPAGILKWLLPREVLTHPSCRTDFVYFVVNRMLRAAIYGSVVVSSTVVMHATIETLTWTFGPAAPTIEPRWWITILVTLFIALVLDFTMWFAHYIYHVVPFLWDYHKVHHSAEVMTPITGARMHPVEEITDASLAGITVGSTYGALAYFIGDAAIQLSLFEVNIILAAFFLAAFNLRHSHVWVRYPVWLQHIFVCPAQHQIHHSRARQHWDKNMGFIFAFWDWAAGTLYTPRGKEEIVYGLGTEEDGGAWHSVGSLYLRPFQQSWARIRGLLGQRETG